jgi:hypothetical protein
MRLREVSQWEWVTWPSRGASAIPGAKMEGGWLVLATSTGEGGVLSLPALKGSGARSSTLLLSWRGSQSPRGSGEGSLTKDEKVSWQGWMNYQGQELDWLAEKRASRGMFFSKELRHRLELGYRSNWDQWWGSAVVSTVWMAVHSLSTAIWEKILLLHWRAQLLGPLLQWNRQNPFEALVRMSSSVRWREISSWKGLGWPPKRKIT